MKEEFLKTLEELDRLAGIKEGMSLEEVFFRRTDQIRKMHDTLGYDKSVLEIRKTLFILYYELTKKFRLDIGVSPQPPKKKKKKATEEGKTYAKKPNREPEVVYKKPTMSRDSYYQNEYYKKVGK